MQIEVRIAITCLKAQVLEEALALHERQDSLYEYLIDLVGAVDRQAITTCTALATGRCELQALIRV